MSKQQVTITSLMKKWSLIADYHYSVRKAEMESFFSEAKDSAIPEDEIIKYKDKIICLWCPLSWADAKKKYKHWKDRKKWENLKEEVTKDFRELYKEYVYSLKEAEHKEKENEDNFDNVEDLIAWAEKNKKRVANGNG